MLAGLLACEVSGEHPSHPIHRDSGTAVHSITYSCGSASDFPPRRAGYGVPFSWRFVAPTNIEKSKNNISKPPRF